MNDLTKLAILIAVFIPLPYIAEGIDSNGISFFLGMAFMWLIERLFPAKQKP